MPDTEKKLTKLKHIAIAGNIGSGKTTLTEKLCKQYGWKPQFEDTSSNPYISDFYEDMPRWSFHMQIYYLDKRFKKILEIRNGEETITQDRTIYEDAFIFAKNLHEMGLMNSRDYETYLSIFNTLNQFIKPPDLLIYLKASIPTLVDHIQKRGRDFEDSIRLDYLKKLNHHYEEWISNYKGKELLVINVDDLNLDKTDDLSKIYEKINSFYFGLFSE